MIRVRQPYSKITSYNVKTCDKDINQIYSTEVVKSWIDVESVKHVRIFMKWNFRINLKHRLLLLVMGRDIVLRKIYVFTLTEKRKKCLDISAVP